MKSLLTAVLIVLCAGLFSCQKEVDDIFTNSGNTGGNGNTSGLLVKTVAITGSDSLTTLYGYDSQKRLETITMDGFSNGIQMHSYKKYIRDASARISEILQVVEQNGIASDTTVETVHYPTNGMEFDYTINTISMFGFATIDSSVYTYSGGNMASMTSNLSSPLLGSSALMITKTDFSYDASGNVSSLKMYSNFGVGSTMTPISSQTYTYGSAINATWISSNAAQNFLLLGTPSTSNKAFTKAQIDDLTSPANSFTITATYNVVSNNQPTSATMVYSSGQITKYTFFYQ
jgi:hypothetical protein